MVCNPNKKGGTKEMKKENKGITLVALVITIIVLIILAGVSINAVMSDGLIGNAKTAKNEWDEAKAEETNELKEYEIETDFAVQSPYITTSPTFVSSSNDLIIIPVDILIVSAVAESIVPSVFVYTSYPSANLLLKLFTVSAFLSITSTPVIYLVL